ncbi:MAG: putative photosynthetic complex assembly protein PuhE [Pseudomonadota bacterium]
MSYVAPILFALGIWWFSTVLMMWRSKRAEPGCRRTMLVMTVLAGGGFAAIWLTRDWTSDIGAYLAFVGGLSIWAWHEMSYFLAIITGPRPEPCPPDVSGISRFWLGIKASLWHELAVIATAAVLIAMTWNTLNAFGAITFTVLWLMRWSAKLNIFLGVRNLHEEFWPDHLRYLGSYVHTAPMNALFPVSMIGGTLVMVFMIQSAVDAMGLPVAQTGWLLVATLMALAMLEHLLMFLQVSDEKLWRFATGSDQPPVAKLAPDLTTGPGS